MYEWLDNMPIDGHDAVRPMLKGKRRIVVCQGLCGTPHVLLRPEGPVQLLPKNFRAVQANGKPALDNALVVCVADGVDEAALEALLAFLQEEAQFGPADVVRPAPEPVRELTDSDDVAVADGMK